MENNSHNPYYLLLDDTAKRIGCLSLYRYRPINADEIDALERGYIWFQQADKLNDPLEGSIKLKEVEQDTIMQIDLHISSSINGGEPKRQTTLLEVPDLIRQSNDYYKREFQAMLPRTKVCCFSKSKNIELMWSHYTDKHRGMVLEYDISFDINNFRFAIPVSYHKELPEINFMAQKDKSIISVLRNKSDDWKYEQEVRLVNDNPRGTPNRIRINMESLRGVIFGCNASNEDIDKVKTALKKYPHVKYQHRRKSSDKYGYVIEPALSDNP